MMFRDKSISKLYAFALALLFTVALAGCGGGGGGSVMKKCPEGQIGTYPACEDEDDDSTASTRGAADPKSVIARAMAIMDLEPDADVEPVKEFGAGEKPFDADDGSVSGVDRNYKVYVDPKDGTVTVTDLMAEVDAPGNANNDDKELDIVSGTEGGYWNRSTFERENKDADDVVTSTETVTVYTDFEAPTPTDFAKVRNAAGELTQALNTNENDATSPVNQSLAVASDALANIGGVPAAATGGSLEIPYENDLETEDVNEASFDGTYNGAAGTYECTAGDCSTTSNDKGAVTAIVGTWRFTPDPGVKSPVPDYDYLHYGFWVDSSTDEDGNPVYKVQTFAGGEMEFDAVRLTTLSGYGTAALGADSATYTGTAAGVYAQKTEFDSGTGALVSGHVGSFTADVRLDAEFGEQTSVVQTEHNTISGIISDFMDGEVKLGWTAELKSKAFAVVGETSGSDSTAAGSWTSSFFGPSEPVDHDDDDTTANAVPMPTGVAGEFITHFGNGHAAGAYGATR